MLLNTAVNIARDAGRQAVRDVMEARQRSNPWEITECWLKIAIAQALYREAREPGSPLLPIHDEFLECNASNLGSDSEHPLDIVVLYPMPEDKNRWDRSPAIGVIEIKKALGNNVSADAKRLARLASSPPALPSQPLKWVMFVVFINGTNAQVVSQNESRVTSVVQQCGLAPLTTCQPQSAPQRPAAATGDDSWFDIMCYGKDLTPNVP
jgi:hypothetical protein